MRNDSFLSLFSHFLIMNQNEMNLNHIVTSKYGYAVNFASEVREVDSMKSRRLVRHVGCLPAEKTIYLTY